MDASTTRKQTRVEQCKVNAKARSEKKRQAAIAALSDLQREQRPITKATLARRAGVSVVFLRKHPDLLHAIEEAEKARPVTVSTASSSDKAKDHVIAALRRRLDDLKQQLAAKDTELRQKQREIDRLYGKLAAASTLSDGELRRALTEALGRLAQQEMHAAEMNEGTAQVALLARAAQTAPSCFLKPAHKRVPSVLLPAL